MKNICNLALILLVLCLSTLAGAQASTTTLLVKTDMNCNWKLDGQPMDLLKVDSPKIVLVSPGEHLIEAATTDGLANVRTNVEVNQTEKSVDIQLKSKYDQHLKMQHEEEVRVRSGAPQGPIWTDPVTGLMWDTKDNGSDITWPNATAYCSKLQLGGYHDWRLATIEELQGLYDPSVSIQTKFDNGVIYNVHVKGNLKLTGWNWSSSQSDIQGRPWSLVLDGRKPEDGFPSNGFSYSMRALCVRRSGE